MYKIELVLSSRGRGAIKCVTSAARKNVANTSLVQWCCLGNGVLDVSLNHWYSVFPSCCNIRLQGREPCYQIKLQKDLNLLSDWLTRLTLLQPKLQELGKAL